MTRASYEASARATRLIKIKGGTVTVAQGPSQVPLKATGIAATPKAAACPVPRTSQHREVREGPRQQIGFMGKLQPMRRDWRDAGRDCRPLRHGVDTAFGKSAPTFVAETKRLLPKRSLSFFATLLRNPLRIIPAAV